MLRDFVSDHTVNPKFYNFLNWISKLKILNSDSFIVSIFLRTYGSIKVRQKLLSLFTFIQFTDGYTFTDLVQNKSITL